MNKRKSKDDKNKLIVDIIKSTNCKNRNDEIIMFNKSINYSNVFKNKKKYSRNIKHKTKFSFDV